MLYTSQVAAPVQKPPHDPRTSYFEQFALQATRVTLYSAMLNGTDSDGIGLVHTLLASAIPFVKSVEPRI